METVVLNHQTLTLLPEKAVYLPQQAALLVSDVHLGKSETFQHCGIPIPSQVNQATLQRLQQAQSRTQATRLFILGDLFHARSGMVDEVIDAWLKFLATTQFEAHLILGNHDRPLASELSQFSLTCYTEPIDLDDILLSHEPLPNNDTLNVCGHIHPCVQVGGKGDRLRLPCFYWEAALQRLTLPSFGDFTGGHTISLTAETTAYAIADDAIVPFSR
ncbi:ligase-associated DNA damage response endonuclease PdeM [Leptolyngbya iicbica]|uniref:Ligase-associated DNA damage response endonuclease PdeM n=2 Tax=Cyanophyceae TaxID=3028117 RepID=A0A4Q7E725_9CYAN|nr:ligase-associated DNA damage response endonuclease PdeM [Leptolyngbya sp. LK]RZM77914.1 ligase-associated DNA damage response endonuclease PdeM [Leptolyngbya sp. LK]